MSVAQLNSLQIIFSRVPSFHFKKREETKWIFVSFVFPFPDSAIEKILFRVLETPGKLHCRAAWVLKVVKVDWGLPVVTHVLLIKQQNDDPCPARWAAVALVPGEWFGSWCLSRNMLNQQLSNRKACVCVYHITTQKCKYMETMIQFLTKTIQPLIFHLDDEELRQDFTEVWTGSQI